MKKVLGLLLIGYFLAGRVSAQTNQKPNPGSSSSQVPGQNAASQIKVNVNLENVLFTVIDKKNRLVTNLNRDDFKVYENGTPQKILFFNRETNLPLRIGVLIDTSNSIRMRLSFEQEAANDFLYDIIRPDSDRAFVVGFDVEPVMVQDYTSDLDKLKQGINALQAGGGTGLYDAIYFACKEKMIYNPAPEPYLRRVLIVVSDGQDNFSQHSREEALSMAQKAEATVYAISTNWFGIHTRGDKVLQYLAKETGGDAFFPVEASDLAGEFKKIGNELRSQYSLAYAITAHDGSFRKITIKTDEKGLRVQAKAGYFAPSR
ncbi:MAG TPA: VWA domain-containing protein [Terriglobia bacterium]|nr:VWA domain-containing protein [Terriglobia bacterium]